MDLSMKPWWWRTIGPTRRRQPLRKSKLSFGISRSEIAVNSRISANNMVIRFST
jgi:hypothetical protein